MNTAGEALKIEIFASTLAIPLENMQIRYERCAPDDTAAQQRQ